MPHLREIYPLLFDRQHRTEAVRRLSQHTLSLSLGHILRIGRSAHVRGTSGTEFDDVASGKPSTGPPRAPVREGRGEEESRDILGREEGVI